MRLTEAGLDGQQDCLHRRAATHPTFIPRKNMNTKKLIAAVAIFAAAGSTFAAEVTEGVWPAFTSTKTRAEVVAELKAAQADGSYALAQQQYDGQFPQAAAQYAKAHGNANTAVAGRAVNNGQAN